MRTRGRHRGPLHPSPKTLHYCTPDWDKRTLCGLNTNRAMLYYTQVVKTLLMPDDYGYRSCKRCIASELRIREGRPA